MDSNIKKYFQTYIQTSEGGFHSTVYPDSKGIATIGYGTNLTTDFAKSYITNILKYDYQDEKLINFSYGFLNNEEKKFIEEYFSKYFNIKNLEKGFLMLPDKKGEENE